MNPNFQTLLQRELVQRVAAIEQALEDLREDELWIEIAPTTNSVGNLVLHLSGNLATYILKGVGGREFVRDRALEFTARGIPKAQVLLAFLTTIHAVREVLSGISDERFAEPGPGPEFPGLPRSALALHAIEHLGYHTGQIVLSTKVLTAGRAAQSGA